MAKKNFLVFMTDHQRGDMQPTFGKAYTPNLDKLFENGTTFSNAYCPSPHCCPSRATFFSGLYPSEHGIWNNVDVSNTLSRKLFDDVRLFSEDLKDNGYNMYFSGKWHVSAEEGPADRGFEIIFDKNHVVNVDDKKVSRYKKYENLPDVREWDRYSKMVMTDMEKPRKEAQILRPGYPLYTQYGINENPHGDIDTVNAAKEKLEAIDKDEPFFMYVGTLGPHDPYVVPQKYLDMYDINDIELPPSFEDDMNDKPALYRRTRDRYSQLTRAEHKESVRRFLAFCTFEDALFGELLDVLEKREMLEDTVVIYVSDHGDYVGAHKLWAKGLPAFKEAYNVCSTVGYGGVKAKGNLDASLVSLADWAPTILEIAEIDAKRKFTGLSLLPLINGEKPEFWRDAIYTQTNGNEVYGIQRAVFDYKYKYVFNGFDYDELYDLEKDPHEINNIINEEGSDVIVESFCKKLWQFAYEHKDNIVNDYIMTALVPYGPGIVLDVGEALKE